MLIHVGRANVPVDVALHEDLHHVGRGLHDEGRQVFDVDARVLVPQVQLRALLVQQIANLFVVDLKVGDSDKVLLLGVRLDLLEDVIKGTGHDTLELLVIRDACDRVSLARTGLAVGKNGAVVALNDILTHGVGRLCKDFLLLRAIKGNS